MKKKVLIIDDSDTNNILIKSLLEEKTELIVSTENRSAKAIKSILKFKPDIIILDLMMPVIDGFSILTAIKSNNTIKHIPVIVISAKQEESAINLVLKMGAVEYIKKPINVNNILEKVLKILNITI